ncbi:ankyrin repeat and BTB/POZ domain-containing protein 1-like [Oppia nitens]|uniref:ankyrin repeat and BTB/POZ domain-containing protein 1-like n=1 Tax=Oppia nitens TaxID=1686743 RepID=UPI0023D98080|nr:ankyrin repeat and BTB/POZ domain-containing protein 1-like [Oppia nitens]
MDLQDLFQSCKKGDLNIIKQLVDQKEVELNVRDKWDSTPLYYACLCGHTNVVRYLLKSGARCEANTFDGERCVYGALTPEIRNILLKDYLVITSKTIQRNHYDEFLRKCLESGDYFDVIFSVHNRIFKVHRSILSVTCDYFNDMFKNKWKNRKIIYINNYKVNPLAFNILLLYLYTGRLECDLHLIEDVKSLVKQCKLYRLLQQIDDSVKKIHSFECTKPGTNVSTITVESETHSHHFNILYLNCIPRDVHFWIDGSELPFLTDFSSYTFFDVYFNVENQLFKCHKVFFSGRSDYFKALFNDHFMEAKKQINGIQVFELFYISIQTFLVIASYIYQNSAQFNLKNAYEVIMTADLYLMPGLKRQCANFIGQHLTVNNVISTLLTSRLLQLTKLEGQCAEFMAQYLHKIINKEEFKDLIINDAKEVKGRQETDTIDIIDDIRYNITNNVQTFSAMSEANDKLRMIEELLENIGLDA